MKVSCVVTKEMYIEYLDYKFKSTNLPKTFLQLYRYAHEIKNYMTGYSYPRKYVYELKKDSLSKITLDGEQIIRYKDIIRLDMLPIGFGLTNIDRIMIFIYVDKKDYQGVRATLEKKIHL